MLWELNTLSYTESLAQYPAHPMCWEGLGINIYSSLHSAQGLEGGVVPWRRHKAGRRGRGVSKPLPQGGLLFPDLYNKGVWASHLPWASALILYGIFLFVCVWKSQKDTMKPWGESKELWASLKALTQRQGLQNSWPTSLEPIDSDGQILECWHKMEPAWRF